MSIPAAPTNLLSRNVGNGSVELEWSASVGAISYNLYLSTSQGGSFIKANLFPITDTKAILFNFVFGTKVYFKATAVNAVGESAQSALARDAKCGNGTTTLLFKSLVGDQILAGAVFTAQVGARLVAFQTLAAGICQ